MSGDRLAERHPGSCRGAPTISREIVTYPEPVLRDRAREPRTLDARIQALGDEMIAALAGGGGIGLAAPQVGERLRLILIDLEDDFHLLVNPEIVEIDDEEEPFPEGCLSIPGIEGEVWRPRRALIRAYTLDEREIELERKGLHARVLLHEIDHLNGVLFIDHLGAAKRAMLLKEYERLQREGRNTGGAAEQVDAPRHRL